MGEQPVEPQEAGGGGLGACLCEKHKWAKNVLSSCASLTHRAWGRACKYQPLTFWSTQLTFQSCHWQRSKRRLRVLPAKWLLLRTPPGQPTTRYDVLQPLPGGDCCVLPKANCAVPGYLSKKSLKRKSITCLHSNGAGKAHDTCANPEFLFLIQTTWVTSVN